MDCGKLKDKFGKFCNSWENRKFGENMINVVVFAKIVNLLIMGY